MKIQFVDIDGIRTRHLHEGDGPPLLLIHPVGTSGDMFCRNIDVLAKDFTVVSPDVLGHGWTGMIDLDGGPPQPEVVKHLGKLIDKLGFNEFYVGGLLSSLLYFRPAGPGEKSGDYGQRVDLPPARTHQRNAQGIVRQRDDGDAESDLGNGRPAPGDKEETVPTEVLLNQLTVYAMPDRIDAYRQTMEGMAGAADSKTVRVYHRREEMNVPTLVIVGRNDIRTDWKWHEKGVARMPNARIEIFEECGHLPQCEHPDKLNKLVREFLVE